MFELPVPEADGLVTPEANAWSADKHHFLRRYIDAFTTSMKAKGWRGLHYIDLFASAGIELIRGNGLDWGSPLIAAQAPNRFARLHLCELDPTLCSALTLRVRRYTQPQPPQIINGDANRAVREVVRSLPDGSLSLAFLDPHGLHLHFETLQVLATRRVDLVIFFPDYLDAIRNEGRYADQPDSNLDRVLGGAEWRRRLSSVSQARKMETLRDIYVEQIQTLGYVSFEFERISMATGSRLYQIIFCSQDPTGGKIWRGVSKRKPDGQDTFLFESE